MSVKFNDFDIECYVISAFLQGPDMWKNIPEAWFHDPIARAAYKEMQTFQQPPYSTFATAQVLMDKAKDPNVKLFAQDVSNIVVDRREINVKLYDLFEMHAARKIINIAESLPNDLDKTKVETLIRGKITELSSLVNPFEAGQRVRGLIYEGARQRWQKFKDMEADPSQLQKLLIPFGIRQLDEYTNGGLRPGRIAAVFAESGGMKSKFKANIAYNASFIYQKDVMVITLEVPFDDYAHIIDSRNAMLDFNSLQNAQLGEMRDDYRQSLIRMSQEKPSLYLVDIPASATTADLIAETELYYVKFGKYPDLIVMDYVNEMSPVSSYNNTSEKFKNVGLEIRHFTRSYYSAFLTSLQENREGKKIKDKSKVGAEHVGESHYFQNVCHFFAHLYQDAAGVDAAANQLNMGIKKNRYGPKNVSFAMFADPAKNYIGDYELLLPSQSLQEQQQLQIEDHTDDSTAS